MQEKPYLSQKSCSMCTNKRHFSLLEIDCSPGTIQAFLFQIIIGPGNEVESTSHFKCK